MFQLHNNGPSVISKATMNIQWPQTFNNDTLLYITSYDPDGPIQCHTSTPVNPLNLKVSAFISQCILHYKHIVWDHVTLDYLL